MIQVNPISGGDTWKSSGTCTRTSADTLIRITVRGNQCAIFERWMPIGAARQSRPVKMRNTAGFWDAICRVVLLAWIVLSVLIVLLVLNTSSVPPRHQHPPPQSRIVA